MKYLFQKYKASMTMYYICMNQIKMLLMNNSEVEKLHQRFELAKSFYKEAEETFNEINSTIEKDLLSEVELLNLKIKFN